MNFGTLNCRGRRGPLKFAQCYRDFKLRNLMMMGISECRGSGKGVLLDEGTEVNVIFCGLNGDQILRKGNMELHW